MPKSRLAVGRLTATQSALSPSGSHVAQALLWMQRKLTMTGRCLAAPQDPLAGKWLHLPMTLLLARSCILPAGTFDELDDVGTISRVLSDTLCGKDSGRMRHPGLSAALPILICRQQRSARLLARPT